MTYGGKPDGIVNSVIDGLDSILGVVDDIGAVKYPVYIITRTWQGRKGIGTPEDEFEQILPTPHQVNYSQDIRTKTGGAIEAGDILLTMISKERYPSQKLIDLSIDREDETPKTMERYYFINDTLYEVKNVRSKYVCWNVLLRAVNKREVYD